MAESAISPAELFKADLSRAKDIPALKRTDKDKFLVYPTPVFATTVDKALLKVKGLKPGYKLYLREAVQEVAGKLSPAALTKTWIHLKSEVNQEEAVKYFGEVLGALHVARKRQAAHICYPVRSNYELFDYFVSNGKSGWIGYSAKALSGGTNTLAPKIIADRIEKSKVPVRNVGAKVLLLLANAPTFQGTVEAVGLLVEAGIFPKTMHKDVTLQRAFKKIAWSKDAVLIEAQKHTVLRKIGLSDAGAYEAFLVKHVVPRMRNTTGDPKTYTATNLVYGLLAMFLADTSKEHRFNITPLITALFPDLNIVKMGIPNATGVPDFHLSNRGTSKDAVILRSKARWDTIKDKLGVQL